MRIIYIPNTNFSLKKMFFIFASCPCIYYIRDIAGIPCLELLAIIIPSTIGMDRLYMNAPSDAPSSNDVSNNATTPEPTFTKEEFFRDTLDHLRLNNTMNFIFPHFNITGSNQPNMSVMAAILENERLKGKQHLSFDMLNDSGHRYLKEYIRATDMDKYNEMFGPSQANNAKIAYSKFRITKRLTNSMRNMD